MKEFLNDTTHQIFSFFSQYSSALYFNILGCICRMITYKRNGVKLSIFAICGEFILGFSVGLVAIMYLSGTDLSPNTCGMISYCCGYSAKSLLSLLDKKIIDTASKILNVKDKEN